MDTDDDRHEDLERTAETERRRFAEQVAVSHAEKTVAAARSQQLLAEQTAAKRRWAAAKGLLTKAQRDGDAEKIRAARERADHAYAEFDRISHAAIDEQTDIVRAHLDTNEALLDQMGRSTAADQRLTDEVRRKENPS